jgi:hypothetical protein
MRDLRVLCVLLSCQLQLPDQRQDEAQKKGCCGGSKEPKEKVEVPPQVPLRKLLAFVPEMRWRMVVGTICEPLLR